MKMLFLGSLVLISLPIGFNFGQRQARKVKLPRNRLLVCLVFVFLLANLICLAGYQHFWQVNLWCFCFCLAIVIGWNKKPKKVKSKILYQ